MRRTKKWPQTELPASAAGATVRMRLCSARRVIRCRWSRATLMFCAEPSRHVRARDHHPRPRRVLDRGAASCRRRPRCARRLLINDLLSKSSRPSPRTSRRGVLQPQQRSASATSKPSAKTPRSPRPSARRPRRRCGCDRSSTHLDPGLKRTCGLSCSTKASRSAARPCAAACSGAPGRAPCSTRRAPPRRRRAPQLGRRRLVRFLLAARGARGRQP